MRKKVLFVIYSIYGGGAEKQMRYILKYIDRKKFEPHLAVFRITGKEKEVVPEDVPVYDLSTRLRPASFFLCLKLASLVKKIKPDRILSFMWGAGVIAVLTGIFFSVPVVVSERAYVLNHLKEYSFFKIREFLISVLYGNKQVSKIVSVTDDVKKGLEKEFKLSPGRIITIRNAIDLREIAKLSDEYTVPHKDYVFSVGRFVAQKNFSFLIEVMAGIREHKLVILGDGSQKDYLKNKAEELGIDLILPGYVENPYPYFKNAKVFVLTSLYEGFPNVVLEAMACGVPVVAVDCPGGIREIIKDGENGIIVPQGNKKMMAGKILELLENKTLRNRLANNAREFVKRFGIKEMVEKYESVIG